jgi:DNA-binding TFAR19-related protein (PDSD5 family)
MSFQLPQGMRPAPAPGKQEDPEAAQRQAAQAEAKRTMIQAMLEPAARERRE